jgi:glycosyltransferase involved in cell wall biosynthesis
MNILSIDNKQTGCYLIRTKVPQDVMNKRGHEWRCETGKGLQFKPADWDLIIFNRGLEGDFESIKKAVEVIKKTGTKIVFDTDDALDIIPPFNLARINRESLKSYFYFLKNADLVTTTTEWLGERLKKNMNKKAELVILPNCINPKHWKIRQGGNKKLRIGFAGSNTHIKDILMVIDVIIDLQNEIDFEFVLFGFHFGSIEDWLKNKYQQNEFGSLLLRLYIKLNNIKNFRWEPAVPIDKYPDRLAKLNFDIGICPLEDNNFNRCKSAIKLYEYAMVGTPVLASRVLPYSPEMDDLMTVKNRYKDWKKKLRGLILNEQERQKMAEIQRNWVLECRDINLKINDRERAYISLSGK